MIELINVTKTYNNTITAIKDISLKINDGDIFGIIGLSGAGKSTLVRMMNYLEKPTDGLVLFEGKNLGELKESELRKVRKEIGMIFQNFNLLSQSNVQKNVLFPLEISKVSKSISLKKVKELLKLVDLSEKEYEYPSKLSGGQKQRVAIARALATNPKVLLCDEATSALDPKTTTQILELLKKINKELGVTIIIITHQMNVIESTCDRVAILDNSRVAEIGYVKDVFKSPKSDIGKKLIFGASDLNKEEFVKPDGKVCLRLAFDENTTDEPVLSNIILETSANISILYANTKLINNKTVGQLIVEVPPDKKVQNKIKELLDEKKVTYWEVD